MFLFLIHHIYEGVRILWSISRGEVVCPTKELRLDQVAMVVMLLRVRKFFKFCIKIRATVQILTPLTVFPLLLRRIWIPNWLPKCQWRAYREIIKAWTLLQNNRGFHIIYVQRSQVYETHVLANFWKISAFAERAWSVILDFARCNRTGRVVRMTACMYDESQVRHKTVLWPTW